MSTYDDYRKINLQKDFDDKMKDYRKKWEKEIIKKLRKNLL